MALLPVFLISGGGQETFAQDLNPTVEVSRQYRGTLTDLNMPSVPMALPDSLLRFNLEFDYSVFDNPFKGAYEFRPFLMDLDLAPSMSGERSLYVRAGAGYSLHPELEAVWSPVGNERFRLSVFASHRSYIGELRSLGPVLEVGPALMLPDGTRYDSYDMVSAAGVNGALDWDTGVFSFLAGYSGTALKDTIVTRSYDGADLKLRVSSKKNVGAAFVYDFGVDYRYAEDKFACPGLDKDCLTEHDFSFDGSAGGAFRNGHSFVLDTEFDFACYGGVYDSDAGNVSLTPRYVYSKGRWNLNLGVEFAFLFRTNRSGSPARMNAGDGQIIYPDIRIGWEAIREHMELFLKADGGTDINRYSSLLARDRHITPCYNADGSPLISNTVERISLSAGMKGNIASRFSYSLEAGYRNFGNAPTASLSLAGGRLLPGLGYSAFQMFYAALDCSWVSQDVEISGWLRYRTTDIAERNPFLFAPSAFTGYADFTYNWKKRIFAGVGCGFSAARHAAGAFPEFPEGITVPGYADLGVYFEYAFTRKFSLWLKGGNLLDMTIQRTPLFAESGISFTAGICLNL